MTDRENGLWYNLDKSRPDSAHYSIMGVNHKAGATGMEGLRAMFPEAKANDLNLVLFSTSGVHGTYQTIEESENHLLSPVEDETFSEVTFVIVHPRLVALRYGVCNPETVEDIAYLKALRQSSWEVVVTIGASA